MASLLLLTLSHSTMDAAAASQPTPALSPRSTLRAVSQSVCGATVSAVLDSGTLKIAGTEDEDALRVWIDESADKLAVFDPAIATTPTWSFDTGSVQRIEAETCGGSDLLVFDDSGGSISERWALEVDGGDGADIVLGRLDDLSIPDALALIEALREAYDLVEGALALLDDAGGQLDEAATLDGAAADCETATCLVTSSAELVRSASEDLVLPTAYYLRDLETELVRPAAETVREAHGRISTHVTGYVSETVHAQIESSKEITTELELVVDEFELLLPTARELLTDTQILYGQAASLGLEVQSRDPVGVFTRTIESHARSISTLAKECAEDPEPEETEPDEDLQDPSGLDPACAELERRIEALEATTDQVGDDEDPSSSAYRLEKMGDELEARGIALAEAGEALGDDEDPDSKAAAFIAHGERMVGDADALEEASEALAADWEAWGAAKESSLEAAGSAMYERGIDEIERGADGLREEAMAQVEVSAEGLHNRAAQIQADLEDLLLVAAQLISESDDDAQIASPSATTCSITPDNSFDGGAGSDVLLGTGSSDQLDGGAGMDMLLGAEGDDLLRGGEGRDVLIAGEGNDQLEGGEQADVLAGEEGADCLYGGGGESVSGSDLSVELGDLFFGGDEDDLIANGDGSGDDPKEVDFAWAGAGADEIRLGHGGDLEAGSFSLQLGNLVFGQDGADEIDTGDGIDLVFGGEAGDTIQTGKGSALSLGGSGGGSGVEIELGDLIFSGGGEDTIDSDDPAADRDDDDIDLIFAGDDGDEIRGYGGGSVQIGGSGNQGFELELGNLVFAGAGEDEIVTKDGIDVIFGEADGDIVEAGRGFEMDLTDNNGSSNFRLVLGDLLFGDDGPDTLHGEDPNADRKDDDIDVIFAGSGADIVRGYGGGALRVGEVTDPSFQMKLGNLVFGGDGEDDIETLSGVDVIFAGAHDDTVEAGRGDLVKIDDAFEIDLGDVIFGQDGDDVLHGDAPSPLSSNLPDGVDTIFGGAGDDEIYGATGGQVSLPEQDFCLLFGNLLFGGTGDDLLRGDYESWDSSDPRGGIDLAFGGDGADTIEGAGGSLIVIGDLSSLQVVIIWFGNVLFGGHGDDRITGGDGSDLTTCTSSALDNFLNGLGVTDLGGAADIIFGGGGNDQIESYDGIDIAFGSRGDDEVFSGNGGLVIVPIYEIPTPINFGNVLFGGTGADHIISKGRIELLLFAQLELDLLFGQDCRDVIEAGDGLNLVFGGSDNDDITAGDGVNLLFGNAEDDKIRSGSGLNLAFGNRGDDTVEGGDDKGGIYLLFGNKGEDEVQGGHGLTLAFGNRDDDGVRSGHGIGILFGNKGEDEVEGGHGLTLAFGNRGHDDVAAGSGLAILFGNRGNDLVRCADGLCLAFGNQDHDILRAGTGLNVLFGNGGDDRVHAGGGLSLLFGNASRDILSAVGGALLAFGGGSDDVFVGGSGLNIAFGNGENDHFFGGSGGSLFFGNRGADSARGGSGTDLLFGNRDEDRLRAEGGTDIVFGNRGNDRIEGGIGKDLLFGNRGEDLLRGTGDACDLMFGNRGADTLYRCQDCDRRFGGRGADTKPKDNSCDVVVLSPPQHGEVRGRVMIDLDGDTTGDIGHAGVTVSAGSLSAQTDEDGWYRIAGFGPGPVTVSEALPAGYAQISTPTAHGVQIGSQGIDLHQELDFVNRATCAVSADGWGCVSAGCPRGPSADPPRCLPVVVRAVKRCSSTGEICSTSSDCPCDDCEPSWEVLACACQDLESGCAIQLDPVTGPSCFGSCPRGVPCKLRQVGDVYTCSCDQPGQLYFPLALRSLRLADLLEPPVAEATPTATVSMTLKAVRMPAPSSNSPRRAIAASVASDRSWRSMLRASSALDRIGHRIQSTQSQAVLVDGSWTVLDEMMASGSFFAPRFRYTSTLPVLIDLTDLYVISDRSELYLDGQLVGSTPLVADWTGLGGGPLDAPYAADPEVAWGEPAYSKGSYLLPSGSHLITIRNIYIPPMESGAPYPDGTTAFRLLVTDGPEPTPMSTRVISPTLEPTPTRTPTLTPTPRPDPPDLECMPLEGLPGLVAWWRLDEQRGEIVSDEIAAPTLNQGLLYGEPGWGEGLVNGALHFDGAATYVEVPDDPSLDFGASSRGDFTVDAWIKLSPESNTDGVQVVISKQAASAAPGYQLYLWNGQPGLQLADASGYSNFGSGVAIPKDSEWHLMAVTVDRDQADGGRFYLDGLPAGSSFDPTTRPGSLENDAALRIGGLSFSDSSHLDAWLDEVEVLRSALSAEAIARLTRARSAGKCSPSGEVGPSPTPRATVPPLGGNSP